MSALRPQLKGCHCTKRCINIVRSSFAMNNLCLMVLGNVKTKRRNSGPEGRDWDCLVVFPSASLRTRLVFQGEVKHTGNFRLWDMTLSFASLLLWLEEIWCFSISVGMRISYMRKTKHNGAYNVDQPQAAYKLPVQPMTNKVWIFFNGCFSASISLCFLEALFCSFPWDCFCTCEKFYCLDK